jgi:hypothetical protein
MNLGALNDISQIECATIRDIPGAQWHNYLLIISTLTQSLLL